MASASPSYIPLSEYKAHSPGPPGTSPSLQELPIYDDQENPADLEADLKPNRFSRPLSYRQDPDHPDTLIMLGGVWQVIKTLVLPLVAIGYLSFCYTVHQRVVPLKSYGLFNVTQEHLAAIKGGITSISIIIISIALWPINDLLSDLKSEEFFRVLSNSNKGVPLSTLNSISSPSFGQFQNLKAMMSRQVSRYWVAGVIASLMVLITSTLAPAALSIQTVLSDGDIMAFEVGAVPAQSVWNASQTLFQGSTASSNSDSAASILWAEMELGVQYSFTALNSNDPSFKTYIVPTPSKLAISTSSRWLTDVMALNPVCGWSSTNITQPLALSTTVAGDFSASNIFGASLVGFDLDVSVQTFDSSWLSFVAVQDPTKAVFNHTTQSLATDGSSVFVAGQCVSNCSFDPITAYPYLNFTGLPSTTVQFTDATWEFNFLVCKPNAVVQTREVRNEGHGTLVVQPINGRTLPKQGNLHPVQAPSLLSIAMMSISGNSGPSQLTSSYQYASLGSITQTDFLFGKQQIASLPDGSDLNGIITNVTMLPIDTLSATYGQMVQSASKAYTGGYLGTAYVPGRLSSTQVVFASSLPHIAVSTIMLVCLSFMIVFAHFRRGKGSEFTLINVAAAVHGSDLPEQFWQMKATPGSNALLDQKKLQRQMTEMMNKKSVILETEPDGSRTLRVV